MLEKKILVKLAPAALVLLVVTGVYFYYASSKPSVDYTQMSLLNLYSQPNY